jgi:uncharacterized protein YndB with AHSA1/START domain
MEAAMPEEKTFVYEEVINAPADLIYRAFTNASALREWLCDKSTTNPVEGGHIYLSWEKGYFASGHFTKLNPDEGISFTWIGKEEPAWTQVDVQITPQNEGENKVVLVHSGLGGGPLWEAAREEISKGWALGLRNLKSTLEVGHDLRVTERPLIGVYPEELTEETAKELDVPVGYGMLIREVIPGYGAEAAGLQANDVVVAVEDQVIRQLRDMPSIMRDFEPGDSVSVTVYRGQKKHSFSIPLSAQKVEALPDSPEELAKELELRNSKVLESLDQALKGVSDAEASFSSGPEEWSAKDVLVHLIHVERENHIWINDLVAGQERFYDEWPQDRLFRIRATLAAYPTINDLLAEFRRSMKETVASVAFLEHDFTRRKASYWRLGSVLLDQPKHVHEHIQQIEDNVRAARAAKPD